MTLPGIAEAYYTYKDGNNNLYFISENEISYKPISLKESSSGSYSGGQPKTIKISQEQFRVINALFEQAFNDKSSHLENRIMGSSILTRKAPDKHCIIKPGSVLINNIETALKNLLH